MDATVDPPILPVGWIKLDYEGDVHVPGPAEAYHEGRDDEAFPWVIAHFCSWKCLNAFVAPRLAIEDRDGP